MTPRAHILGAVLLGLVGLVAIVALAAPAFGSPREFVQDRYRLEEREGDSARFSSPRPPSAVAEEITDRWEPHQRHNDPTGYYLRYADDVIAVTPAAGGGSTIWVDDEDRGYARWYGRVGGWWGTYSGPAEGTRGGGPGAGK